MSNYPHAFLILRIVAIILITISFFLLFIPYKTTYKTSSWAISAYKSRINLDSDYTYSSDNFFERMSFFFTHGWDAEAFVSIMIIVALSLTFIIAILSLFLDFFKGFWIAVIPLAAIVFCMVTTFDSSGYVISGPTLIGSYLGSSVYTQTSVSFGVSVIPTMCTAFAAFACILISGIISFVSKRKAKKESASQSDVTISAE